MQLTTITNHTNQQINNPLAGQRIAGCTDNTLHPASRRTLAVTNDGRRIIDRNAATWAFEQNTHTARFRHKASTLGHYATNALTVTVTHENGDIQEHDISAFDHYRNATTVNVDETANGN